MKNIVIFGATQSGKTTLAGYLYTYSLSPDLYDKAARVQKKVIEKLKIETFTKEMILPSFISTNVDELRRFADPSMSTQGTTKRTHRRQIQLSLDRDSKVTTQCIFIDTPGTHAKIHEKYKGIFEGDFGICAISLGDICEYIDLKRRINPSSESTDIFRFNDLQERLFQPLKFWAIYKSLDSLIVVLTKIDMFLDNHNLGKIIDSARSCLKQEIIKYSTDELEIIPIGITTEYNNDHFSRQEYNVYSCMASLESRSWAQHTLVDALSKMIPYSSSVISENELSIASIDKIVETRNPSGYAIRIKLLAGSLTTANTPFLGPIITKDYTSDTPTMLTGEIKSLKREDEVSTTESLLPGDIGGIKFNYLSSKIGRRARFDLDPKQICLAKTAILTSSKFSFGNMLNLSIFYSDLEYSESYVIEEILPKEQIFVFWFGERLTVNVVQKYYEMDRLIISVLPFEPEMKTSVGWFVLPVDNDGALFQEDIPLVFSKSIRIDYENYKTFNSFLSFQSSGLSTISHVSRYVVVLTINEPFDEAVVKEFSDIAHRLIHPYHEDGKFKLKINEVTLSNINKVYRAIREFSKHHFVEDFRLLSEL